MSVTAATAIRNQGTIEQERFLGPTKLRQAAGLMLPWYNSSTTLTLLAGQPIVAYNRICLVEKAIPPGKMGTVLTDWVAEVMLNPALGAANILQDAVIYWNTTLNLVQRLDNNVASGTVVSGVGGATTAQPGASAGFLLGRATTDKDSKNLIISGGNLVVATAGTDKWITVASLPGVATVY